MLSSGGGEAGLIVVICSASPAWNVNALQTVVLSQLDSLRRELITIAQDSYAAVTYSKVSPAV